MTSATAAIERPTQHVLTVRDLQVSYAGAGDPVRAVAGVDLSLAAGEVLAVVGESGSGKSTLALTLLGLLPGTAEATGSVHVGGIEVLGASPRQLRRIRGDRAAMVFQEPGAALHPALTVRTQLVETIRAHRRVSRRQAAQRAADLLRAVDLKEPARMLASYPFQLSGGQQQRVMLAIALALEPDVLVADEPTTALDVTVQAEIASLLRRVATEQGVGVLVITHDLGLVAQLADHVMVLHKGQVVESAPVGQLYATPRHAYTADLLTAVPRLPDQWSLSSAEPAAQSGNDGSSSTQEKAAPGNTSDPEPVACVAGLVVRYPGRGAEGGTLAVDGVDLQVPAGQTVALVGESGSGKSTIGNALIGLAPVTSGRVRVAGCEVSSGDRHELSRLRPQVGVVFQDPGASLDPRWSVHRAIAEPLQQHRGLSRSALRSRVGQLLDDVHLPVRLLDAYPHELSGGQRQRVGIARALALDPLFVLADEPTSALDVSVQAVVLDLLSQLQQRRGFGCLFISHDLAVVAQVAQRVTVLNAGRVVETGATATVLGQPQHDYTQRLLASVPTPEPRQRPAPGRPQTY